MGCGAVLTSNTTLKSDLDCSGPAALFIGADNITVNLNGHTLRSLDGLGVGISILGHKGVTIKNGVIDGFQQAILAQESSDLTLQGLTIPRVSGHGTSPEQFGFVAAIFGLSIFVHILLVLPTALLHRLLARLTGVDVR